MNRFWIPALLVMAAGGWQTSARAVNKSTTFYINLTVTNPTCTFNNNIQPTIKLDDINARDFTDGAVKKAVNVPVAFSCGDGVTKVSIKPTGTRADENANVFKNMGNARGVGLRFMDKNGNVLPPSGATKVPIASPTGLKGSYVFKAGYVKTGSEVKGGSFSASVNLTFDYN